METRQAAPIDVLTEDDVYHVVAAARIAVMIAQLATITRMRDEFGASDAQLFQQNFDRREDLEHRLGVQFQDVLHRLVAPHSSVPAPARFAQLIALGGGGATVRAIAAGMQFDHSAPPDAIARQVEFLQAAATY